MLALLHERLAALGIMSVLYSDVGDYYSRVRRHHSDPALATGWEITGARHVVWPVEKQSPAVTESKNTAFRKLQEEDLDKICNRDAELLCEEVKASSAASAFAILPTKDQMNWPILRTKFYDNFRHPASRSSFPHIDDWGCQSGNPASSEWAFAIWSYNFNERALTILRLRCTTAEQLKEIVRRAQEAALQQGMDLVTAWNVDERVLAGTGWQNVESKEHLPAMAWYGTGDRPDWLCNEVSIFINPSGPTLLCLVTDASILSTGRGSEAFHAFAHVWPRLSAKTYCDAYPLL